MSEVKIKRQNFSIMWFDCIQGFDSVPQKWLMYALKLAKVEKQRINAKERFTSHWCTIVHVKAENKIIKSTTIHKIFKTNSSFHVK